MVVESGVVRCKVVVVVGAECECEFVVEREKGGSR
jgi:hypothetical protein